MTDIKIKKSVIEAWDWHTLLGAAFPRWFHQYAEDALSQSDVSYGDATATVFPGEQAVHMFESACSLVEDERGVGNADVQFISNCIEKARTTYDLDNKATRVVVWC